MVRRWLESHGTIRQRDTLLGELHSAPDQSMGVLIDYGACGQDFEYRAYTTEQNDLAHTHGALYRFLIDSEDDIEAARLELDTCLVLNFEDNPGTRQADRSRHNPDPTPPEHGFEIAFEEVFGHAALASLEREVCKPKSDGGLCWVDYVVHFSGGWCSVEQNGETYHHPVRIGRERYRAQLLKQNSLVAQGAKVFRWSLAGMVTGDSFHEELRMYFGGRTFRPAYKTRAHRKFTLYDHQQTALEALHEGRERYGRSAALLVLPTGTGKTHIAVQDFKRMLKETPTARLLALAPSRALRDQLLRTFVDAYADDYPDVSVGTERTHQVVVQTNSWACLHYNEFDSKAFDYVLIDEAHHAVAPMMERVVHHFRPISLVGMTATPKRLDQRRLEEVFGEYDTELTLESAIRKGILAPIRAYRVQSNIDLSDVRYNGKDYFAGDLQKRVVAPSRDQLIVDILKRYFNRDVMGFRNGLIFCVSVDHAERMAQRLRDHGFTAKAVHGRTQGVEQTIGEYQSGAKLQFLTTCSLLGEGWDSPRTSIVVMARPTMSKVLYTQQLGRGTRRYPGKEALYVIDVVDNYSSLNAPWSIHGLLGLTQYRPFANVLNPNAAPTGEDVVLDGLYEAERALIEIDIFTFEASYPNHLSAEQLARELFVSTGTVQAWSRAGTITPDVVVPLGKGKLEYYAPGQVDEIRSAKGLSEHTEETQYDDFFAFLNEGSYTFSYKMVMMLKLLEFVDSYGEADVDQVTSAYTAFYRERLDRGRSADKAASPYNSREYLDDAARMQRSLRQNPFEKFERKRFLHEQKDLKRIAFSRTLWTKIKNDRDIERVRDLMQRDLEKWYKDLDESKSTDGPGDA